MSAVEKLITDNIANWALAVQNRSATGRGSSKKIDLYGIKKLRELILELAVRGKLVPQNPKDESASVLLERIAAEKAQLVKDKKIKKQKKLPEINAEEKPFDLPNGWQYARLGDFVSIIRGITFPASEKHREPLEGRVACLRTANVQEHIDWDDLLYVDQKFVKRAEQYLELGDIVMSMANSRELVGKVSFTANIPTEKASFGGFLSVIRPYYLNASFLMAVLRTPHIRNELIGSASQTTNIANISLEKLNPLLVAIPPLEEQHRIVAKVNELMSLCDQLEQQTESSLTAHATLVENLLGSLVQPVAAAEGSLTSSTDAAERTTAKDGGSVENAGAIFDQNWQRIAEHFTTLFTTEESIDQLKQTVLQLAVMGKLVPQNPNDEPASVLLEKISAEKAQLIKEKKIKKQKALPPISEDEKPFELPVGWQLVRFGDIASSRLGKMLDKAKNTGMPKPYLRNTNVQWHRFDLEDVKEMKLENDELAEFLVHPDDLLICEGGEPGRCAIWQDSSTEMYFQKAIHRARPYTGVLVEFLQIFLTLDAGTGALDKYFTGATIKHFTSDKLNKYVLCLPPTNEQSNIVLKVKQLTTLCNQLKTHLQQAQQTRLHLADAMVEEALG